MDEQEIEYLGNDLVRGKKFRSEDEAYDFYNAYAGRIGFSIRRHHKYINRKDLKLVWRIFCCSCQGQREKHPRGTPDKPRSNTRTNCASHIKIELDKNDGMYAITSMCDQHNHELTPSQSYILRSHRKIRSAQKAIINNMAAAGIGSSDIYNYCSSVVGGHTKLNFLQSDCNNVVQKRRVDFLQKGDGQLLWDFFKEKKKENKDFFYDIVLDDNNQIRHCFWSDAEMKMDYQCFGDVVCFDTTYNTNDYELPFAPIIGVNNHRQNIIFSSALISDETTKTFVWVFETFLKAMNGKLMETIFTDQGGGIVNAIKQVMPTVHHRLCIWHIYQNALRNLSHVFTMFETFGDDFKGCIYSAETEEEFFKDWDDMLKKYKLEDEIWLKSLFQLREKWAQVYARDHFCAGIASTQRSESINNYFKKYFKRKLSLREFVDQYGKAVSRRRHKVDEEDVKSKTSMPNLLSNWHVEISAAQFYTRKLFNCFQQEYKMTIDLDANIVRDGVDIATVAYEVVPYHGGRARRVEFSPLDNTVKCSCKNFEFRGILCAHTMIVLKKENVSVLPSQYFLKRWSKEARPTIVVDKVGNNIQAVANIPLFERHSELSSITQIVIEKGSMNKERFELAKTRMHSLILELNDLPEILEDDTMLVDNEDTNMNVPLEETTANQLDEGIIIGAPSHKRSKGATVGRYKGFYDSMKKRKGKRTKTKNSKQGKIDDVTRQSCQIQKRQIKKTTSQNFHIDNIGEGGNIERHQNNDQVSSIPTTRINSTSFSLHEEMTSFHDGTMNSQLNFSHPLTSDNASFSGNSGLQASNHYTYSQTFLPRTCLGNAATTRFASFQALLESQVGFTTNSAPHQFNPHSQQNLSTIQSSESLPLQPLRSVPSTQPGPPS